MPRRGPEHHCPGEGRGAVQPPEQGQRDDQPPRQGGEDQGGPAPYADHARQPGEQAGQGEQGGQGQIPGRGAREDRPGRALPLQQVGQGPAPAIPRGRHAQLAGEQHREVRQGGINPCPDGDARPRHAGPNQPHRLLHAAVPSTRTGQVTVIREHRHGGPVGGGGGKRREQPVSLKGRRAVPGRGGSPLVPGVVHGQVVHKGQGRPGSPDLQRLGLQVVSRLGHRGEGEAGRDLPVVLRHGHGLAPTRPDSPCQGGQGRPPQRADDELHP